MPGHAYKWSKSLRPGWGRVRDTVTSRIHYSLPGPQKVCRLNSAFLGGLGHEFTDTYLFFWGGGGGGYRYSLNPKP